MSLTPTELLRFFLEFITLLGVARILGELARRLNQPQVIGELLAGIIIGPSLFGSVFPQAFHTLFPAQGPQGLLLQLIAQIGVIFLLLLSGLETDIDIVRSKAKPALWIASGGILVPFAAGYGLAYLLPGMLMGSAGAHQAFLLFVATALSISAIPVIVKILLDMNLMRRDIGQLTLASGIINDTVGWFLLAVVSGIAASQHVPINSLLVSILGTIAFAAFCFTLGYRMIRTLVTWIDDYFGGESPVLTAVVLLGLAGAAVTQALHVEAFLGSFLVGVQMARVPRITTAVRSKLEGMTLAIFAPVFFASAGLKVNITQILTPLLLLSLFAVIAVAVLAKFAGTYAGARLAGLKHWMAVSLGSGMNARGAVEIIVATIGLQMGILTTAMYSIIVIMAVVTSIMAPPLLRFALRHTTPDPDETDRLRRQSFEERSFLHGLRRMLVPVRDGRNALLAADIIQRLSGERSIEATVLQVQKAGDRRLMEPAAEENGQQAAAGNDAGGAFGQRFSRRAIGDEGTNIEWRERRIEPKPDIAKSILSECERGYDLVVLGAAKGKIGSGPFGGIADEVILNSPCNAFVLYAPQWTEGIDRLERILIPTTGTSADLRAAEFAMSLAKGAHAAVTALYVIEAQPLAATFSSESLDVRAIQSEENIGWHSIAEILRLGEAFAVPVDGAVKIRTGNSVGNDIVQQAHESRQDLILLSAERRPAGGKLYCGRTVERILRSARCPVGVLFTEA